MSPLANGNMTAAELDRYIVAERAFNDAKAAGKTDDEAVAAAREAAAAKRREQVLRSVGSIR
jgi:hypothetical protein